MVDTHVHHWELGRFRYPWLDDRALTISVTTISQPTIGPDTAEVPVEGWVHIQAEVDHELDPVEETAWMAALA